MGRAISKVVSIRAFSVEAKLLIDRACVPGFQASVAAKTQSNQPKEVSYIDKKRLAASAARHLRLYFAVWCDSEQSCVARGSIRPDATKC